MNTNFVRWSFNSEVHYDPFTSTATNERNFSSSLLLSENVQNYWSETTMISITCRTPFSDVFWSKTTFFTTFEKHLFLTAATLIFIFLMKKCLPFKKEKLTFWSTSYCDTISDLGKDTWELFWAIFMHSKTETLWWSIHWLWFKNYSSWNCPER